MTTKGLQGMALGLALALLSAGGATAQSVAINGGTIEIFDTDGDSAVLIDQGADYAAGGNGRSATLTLRSLVGPTTLSFHAFQAQLILGGGVQEGLLLLKDDDGATTTFEADGRTGSIRLGGNNEDGDLIVYDNADVETIRLDGQSGNVTNLLSGDGLVKAWARISSDDSVFSCYRCNPAATFAVEYGEYQVDFSPLGESIRSRPRVAVIDSHQPDIQSGGAITIRDSDTLASALVVHTYSSLSQPIAKAFTVIIY
jgi:hypothetical protein